MTNTTTPRCYTAATKPIFVHQTEILTSKRYKWHHEPQQELSQTPTTQTDGLTPLTLPEH